VRDKLRHNFVDLGDKQLKNIARPVRAYAVTLDRNAAKSEPDASEKSPVRLAMPDKPSIAVLPFDNLSGDREQEYFADGIVEEIITGLSRIKWLFVISRNSTFIYKGKPIDVKTVGRELGVRYVLEGSVRRSGNHVRVTGQLIETETATNVWADRYDGTLSDIFAHTGRDDNERHRCRRTDPAHGGSRTCSAQAARQPGRLRSVSARAPVRLNRNAARRGQSAPLAGRGDPAGAGLCRCPWDHRLVPRAALPTWGTARRNAGGCSQTCPRGH
jgi:adenylate cyclase